MKRFSAAAVALAAVVFAAGAAADVNDAAPPSMNGVYAGGATTAPPPQDANDATAYTPPTAAQLIELLAPVAVFPDKLVAQVLAAASHPDQVAEANDWLAQNGGLKGAALQRALDEQSWDPGVKAVVTFPDVLRQMASNPQWTAALGEAYVNDPVDVLNAVQVLRDKAVACGNLKSNKYIDVKTVARDDAPPPVSEAEDDAEPPTYAGPPVVPPPDRIIEIEPAEPDYVYVPYYDPVAFYGAPIAPWPGYAYAWPAPVYYGPAFGLLAFGVGIAIDVGFGHSWGWHAWDARWGHGYYGHGWRGPSVVYHNRPYFDHSRAVVNHFEQRRSYSNAFAHGSSGAGRPGFGGGRFASGDARDGARSGGFGAAGASRAGAVAAMRSAAFARSPARVDYGRMSMPRFTSTMTQRSLATSPERTQAARTSVAGSRSAFAGAGGARGGALASSRYAPATRTAAASRYAPSGRSYGDSAPAARASAGLQRQGASSFAARSGSYRGYAGAESYARSAPSYSRAAPTYSAGAARGAAMPAQRYSASRAPQGGGYSRGGGGSGAPRSFSSGGAVHSAPHASVARGGGGRAGNGGNGDHHR
ncbi:MAG TPA: DUF3300 domain-containing protein [Dokdonella sp.]